MKTYELYGASTLTTEELARILQSKLGVAFEPRRSAFIGDYFRAEVGDEWCSVEPNADDERDEDELLEPVFADWAVLLYVDRTERGDALEKVFVETGQLRLLRRQVVEDGAIRTLAER